MTPHIREEAVRAYEKLSPKEQSLIGADALAVLRTAIRNKSKDGLIDAAIPAALTEHRIFERGEHAMEAYKRFLIHHFLFGSEAVAAARKRNAQRAEGGTT